MKIAAAFLSFFVLCACAQDGPNIKQIENMQFFIDNKKIMKLLKSNQGFNTSLLRVEIQVDLSQVLMTQFQHIFMEH